MAKFGELIQSEVPTLIAFYSEFTMDKEAMDSILRDVSATIGTKGRVIKIDINKNVALVQALRILRLPTYIVYKSAEMKSRTGSIHSAEELIKMLQI